MQVKNLSTRSKNFTGKAVDVLPAIKKFLEEVSTEKKESKHLHLVHALVFESSMTEKETLVINNELTDIYVKTGFSVLGGDTSSGNELNIFISTIVY
jgi:hypothetical protein